LFNASSVHQLRTYGRLFPGAEVSVRINPGKGSGHSNRTNVGGPSSSFGIWHEHLDQVLRTAREFNLRITGMHTHIGSGADPAVWDHCAQLSLAIAARLPEVNRLSLGGGFKVARVEGEKQTDLQIIGAKIVKDFENFAREHGRKLRLEVEPGTYLVANAGAVVCTVIDVVDTGASGYRFIKVDSGMTEVLRPALYGAQHPMRIVSSDGRAMDETNDYLVAGHCCESGDILTPEPGNPEGLHPRQLQTPKVGDMLVIGGAGAYCSGLAAKNYNSFPEAPEALVTASADLKLIRRRQTFDQMVGNEVV
jgi:diaminopimelate decarboxylase